MPTVLKTGSLNLLEPSGPVQVCNGIALPIILETGDQLKPEIVTLYEGTMAGFDTADQMRSTFKGE